MFHKKMTDISLDQLAKPTFRSRYAHIPCGSAPLPILSSEIYLFGFTARQDYFINFEPSQSKGAAKTGDPQEKHLDHPQTELAVSHM